MEEKKHCVVIEERQKLTLSSCEEVVSFNENEIVVALKDETVVIKGSGLGVEEVSRQSGNVVILGGCIDSVVYTRKKLKDKEGLIRRLIK